MTRRDDHDPWRIEVPVATALAVAVLVSCGQPATRTPDVAPTASTAPPVPAVAAPTTAESPSPEPSAGIEYRADWSTGLDGWTGSEDWTARRGMLLSVGDAFRRTATAVAPLDLGQVDDFAVEAEIQLLRYNSGANSFGVMVRVQEDGTGYGVGATADGEVVLRAEMGPGRPPLLDSQPFTPGEEWHRYRVEVRGNELRVLIDGDLALTATDNTFLSGRRVGLWSERSQLSVRSFEVTPL